MSTTSSSLEGVDLESLKVAQLKQHLQERNLAINGIKSELIERLQKAINDEKTQSTDANKQDDTATTAATDRSASATAKPTNGNNKTDTTIVHQQSIKSPPSATTTMSSVASVKQSDNNLTTSSQPIHIDKDSSEEDKIKARAQRFGVDTKSQLKSTENNNKSTTNSSNKRSTSSLITDESDDKKAARLKRFAGSEYEHSDAAKILKNKNTATQQTQQSAEDAEKLRKRAEKFGLNKPT